MEKFVIGSDPEVFVKDVNTGKIMSISGLLGGTKDNPLPIGEGCSVQEDNVLAEFNIPPVNTKDDFIKHINYAKNYISTIIASHGLELHFSSSELVSEDILDDKSKVFGCSPSFNVLTQCPCNVDINQIPPNRRLLRSSGFHIHFGIEGGLNEEQNDRLVMCFELAVSIPLYFKDNDKHNRRELYGRFGDCREKDYGVECRSLGGYFLKDDDTLSEVWDRIEKAVELYNSDISYDFLNNMINSCMDENEIVNKTNAYEILNELETIKIL